MLNCLVMFDCLHLTSACIQVTPSQHASVNRKSSLLHFDWLFLSHCLAREEEGSDPVMHGTPLSSSWDPETEETALLLKFWVPLAAGPAAEQKQNETKDSPPGPPPGEGVVRSPSPDEQSLGRPSQGLLRLPPGLAGAWTGWASCLWPAPRRRTVEGCCRGVGAGAAAGGRPRRQAGWGAAAGVEAAAGILRRMMCLIASVCFCAAENCWAQLSTVSPKRPVCDMGAFMGLFLSSAPSCQWDTARDGAPGPQAWTSHDPETVRSPSSLGARGPSQHAAHVEPPWKPARPPAEKPLVQPRSVGMRWRIPHEPDVLGGPRKHSRHLWVWLGQRYHTRRGQRSRVIIPGERGLALRCSDRHPVIRGSAEGNGWGTPLSRGPSPNQRYHRRLRSAWGVRNSTWGSPHRNPQITSDSTGCCAAPCARANARSRQRQRDPAMFDTAESIAQLRDGHVPTRRTWTIHESLLSVLNAQTREAAIVTVLRHQRSTAPRNARVIRHL